MLSRTSIGRKLAPPDRPDRTRAAVSLRRGSSGALGREVDVKTDNRSWRKY